MYYICLSKLLDVKIYNYLECQLRVVLRSLNLLPFSDRFIYTLFIFIFKLKNSRNSPAELKEYLRTNNGFHHRYNLRTTSLRLITTTMSRTSSGDLIFTNIIGKFLNACKLTREQLESQNLTLFKRLITSNFSEYSKKFFSIFKNFSCNFKIIIPKINLKT